VPHPKREGESMDNDETNSLLREIRDLLVSQQSKYDDHIKKIQGVYAEQVEINAQERKKSVRIIFVLILLLVGLVILAVNFTK
jgi:hypothetical protein